MTNSRFREIAPGTTVELIATKIELDYVPAGQGELKATWRAQEYMPVAGSFMQIGHGGALMYTDLADHATTTLDVADPVTGQAVTLSAAGAVEWLKAWFDYQYNLENAPQE